MMLTVSAIGQGSPLVFFHGWGFDHRIWLSTVKVLQETMTCYLVDLPGFGLSPPMAWPDFKAQLLVKLPPSFALVGWSLGGLFATRLALEEPDRVTHLCNIASSPFFLHEESWPGIKKPVLEGFYSRLACDPRRTLSEFMTLQAPAIRYELAAIPQEKVLKEGLDILAEWDFRAKLIHLTMPVSYHFGRLDTIVPRTLRAVMKSSYPHFKTILFSRSAHVPFLTEPDYFHQALISFLSRTTD